MKKALQRLHWTRCSLQYTVAQAGHIKPFMGGVIRGAMGMQLKKQDRDLYHTLFETRVDPRHPYYHRYQDSPKPYVIQVPLHGPVFLKKGDRFTFDVLLVGKASELSIDLKAVWRDMGENGLGKARIPMHLENCTFHKEKIPTDQAPSKPFHASVHFQTPLKQFHRTPQPPRPDLPLIVRRSVERLAILAHFFCSAPLFLDLDAFASDATQAKLMHESLGWQELRHYSTRRRQEIPLDGWIGSLVWNNIPASLYPILQGASQLHIGKNTTHGLGRFHLKTDH